MSLQKFIELGHASGADRMVLMFAIICMAAVVAGWWSRWTR